MQEKANRERKRWEINVRSVPTSKRPWEGPYITRSCLFTVSIVLFFHRRIPEFFFFLNHNSFKSIWKWIHFWTNVNHSYSLFKILNPSNVIFISQDIVNVTKLIITTYTTDQLKYKVRENTFYMANYDLRWSKEHLTVCTKSHRNNVTHLLNYLISTRNIPILNMSYSLHVSVFICFKCYSIRKDSWGTGLN